MGRVVVYCLPSDWTETYRHGNSAVWLMEFSASGTLLGEISPSAIGALPGPVGGDQLVELSLVGHMLCPLCGTLLSLVARREEIS